MKRSIGFMVLGALFLWGSICQGQETTPPSDENVTEYFMDSESVDGLTNMPLGENVKARPKGKTKSLIKVRLHFIPQMIKSLEDI